MYKFVFYFLLFSIVISGQTKDENTIKQYYYKEYYKDSIVSMEIWKGKDKKLDSLKTYYSNGKRNEVFYYDEKGLKHSNCYQFNDEGKKLVTWNFLHGKLISRTDHKLPFTQVNEDKVKKNLQYLQELNQRTNFNPTSIYDFYTRGSLRAILGNTTLALEDLKRVEYFINKVSKNITSTPSETVKASREKFKSTLYDLMANVYLDREKENYALAYFYKAMASAPNDTRILYNFANLLRVKKSTDLALYYLEKVIAAKPEHAFARWSLSILYSDKGEYQKAMENMAIAFPREKNIIARTDYGGRDLRTIRGLLYHKLGDSEEGIQDLKEALEMDKNNSYAMKNLGIIYLEQEKYDQACQLFEKARKLKYSLVFDENDLDALIESACNRIILPQDTIVIPKPFAYPNPASTSITIENYDFKNFEFEFFDFESNSVLKGKSSNTTIDISNILSGFYILKIYNTNSTQTFKIIKE